jgi:hypothetical protein
MPVTLALTTFQSDVQQCEGLIANAHGVDSSGAFLFPPKDREQITVAAFLNLFIAWESFLESSLAAFMIGTPTLSGGAPVRYVTPPTLVMAKELLVGVMKYFDFANQEYVRRIARKYFQNGYPYEPHLAAIHGDLIDLRTMRNASAHVSTTTQTALESLALRLFAQPAPGIRLYDLLTRIDPNAGNGDTIFVSYKNKLLATAQLIANG